MELCTSRIRWLGHVERSTGWIAEVSKLNVVAQKRRSRPTKICDEVLVDDRMKLGMDCAVRCLRPMVPSFRISCCANMSIFAGIPRDYPLSLQSHNMLPRKSCNFT